MSEWGVKEHGKEQSSADPVVHPACSRLLPFSINPGWVDR